MKKRIIARFQPQAWIRDHAVDIDGARDLDVTDRVLAMDAAGIRQIRDADYESDDLVSGLVRHEGPFCVHVKDSILEFFGVDDLAAISDEMVARERALRAVSDLPPGTRILSIQGEMSDTDQGRDTQTGPNAEGSILEVLDQEHCYSVGFPNGVSVFLSPAELADHERYRVLGPLTRRHHVHLYAVVRVKVCGVDAASHEEAIRKAEQIVDLSSLLQGPQRPEDTHDALVDEVGCVEYADFIESFMVDEVRDNEHASSVFYGPDGVTPMEKSGSEKPDRMPRISVHLDGGLVQFVRSDIPLSVAIVDADSEGADDDEIVIIENEECVGHIEASIVSPDKLDTIFAAFDVLPPYGEVVRDDDADSAAKADHQAQTKYLASAGQSCPHCGGTNILSGPCKGDSYVWAHVECENCGATWRDTYQLTGFTDFAVREGA